MLLALPLQPRVTFEALPATLSRHALSIWAVPTRIQLPTGEGCYLPSNLLGGFPGAGMWRDRGWRGWNRGWEPGVVGRQSGPALLHSAGTHARGCWQTLTQGPW